MIPNVTIIGSLVAGPDGQHVYAGADNAIAVIGTSDETVVGTIPAPGVGVLAALAVTPDSSTLYAIGEPSAVLVANLSSFTVTAQIQVGSSPSSVAVTPDGTNAYVINTGALDIAVVNGSTDQVTDLIATGADPCCVALARNSGVVWVSNTGGPTVSAIDAGTNAILATIPVVSENEVNYQVYDLVVSPDESTVYVSVVDNTAGSQSSYIAAISTSTYSVTQTSPPTGNEDDLYKGLAISADGSTLYVVSVSPTPGVLVLDTSSLSITATLPTDSTYNAPANLALSPDGTQLYTTAYSPEQVMNTGQVTGVVYAIDLTTQQSTQPVQIGSCVQHLTFAPGGTEVWIADAADQQIQVLNTTTNSLLAPISVPGGPNQIAFTQDGSTAYVTEGGDLFCVPASPGTAIAQLNVATQQVTNTIPVGISTQGLVVD